MKLRKRVTLGEPGQQPRNGLRVIHQVIHHNIHLALHAVVNLLQLAGHTVNPAQPLSGLRQEMHSGRSQQDAARSARKERDAGVVFQQFDAIANRGGRFIEFFRCSGEAAGLRDADKGT